jgi:hypothetical protein
MLDGYWLQVTAPGYYWLLLATTGYNNWWLVALLTTNNYYLEVYQATLSTHVQYVHRRGGKTAREVLHSERLCASRRIGAEHFNLQVYLIRGPLVTFLERLGLRCFGLMPMHCNAHTHPFKAQHLCLKARKYCIMPKDNIIIASRPSRCRCWRTHELKVGRTQTSAAENKNMYSVPPAFIQVFGVDPRGLKG